MATTSTAPAATVVAGNIPSFLLQTVPVIHPPHLDGDPTLATEILPGPPSLISVRQPPRKPDPRKPFRPVSYLPTSDPGTTYAGLGGAMVAPMEGVGGSRRKRARMDKSSSGRAQRASARGLSHSVALALTEPPSEHDPYNHTDPESSAMALDENGDPPSRSASLPNDREGSARPVNGRNGKPVRDKGKGKERERLAQDKSTTRVKEEPLAITISEHPSSTPNQDHCSACTSSGALVYCDGCPRAFHLWCLDPPMEANDLPEGESSWFCPGCKISQCPPVRQPPSFMAPLLAELQQSVPTEFQLPEEIRGFFKDVTTGSAGSYMDSSAFKPPRVGRHGFGEERDPYRLRDGKGSPVLCYKCGKSALPERESSEPSTSKRPRRSTVRNTEGQGRPLVSCDFCSLHWHLDCISPPMATLPAVFKKWKCPNHAQNVMPKHRVPAKNNAPPIDILQTRQPNNGMIEVISSDPSDRIGNMPIEEVTINGKRYRVPERVIILDFWNKVKPTSGSIRETEQSDGMSISSSPLTSLSSLDDLEDSPEQFSLDGDQDTRRVAEALFALHERPVVHSRAGPARRTKDKGIQTEYDSTVRLEPRGAEQLTNIMKEVLKELPLSAEAMANCSPNSKRARLAKAARSAQIATSLSSPHRSKPQLTNGNGRSRASTTLTSVSSSASSQDSILSGGSQSGSATRTTPSSISRPVALPVITSPTSEHKPRSLTIRLPARLPPQESPNAHGQSAAATPSKAPASALTASAPSSSRPRRSLRRQTSAASLVPDSTSTSPSSTPAPPPHRAHSQSSSKVS